MSQAQVPYMHGHHSSVLSSHGSRTAANSAAYLLPHLEPGMKVLDVGCGPGSVTLDLAELVGPGGLVVGVDAVESPLVAARAAARARSDSVTRFHRADAYTLPFEAGAFDVAHAHQVLQHLQDPVTAIQEMKRVVRPGGLVALRDADYGSMAWYPEIPELERWLELYRATARSLGAEPDAGRKVAAWSRAAGLENVQITTSTWTYATPVERIWWGGQWKVRSTESSFAMHAISRGLTTQRELRRIAAAWAVWSHHDDAWFTMVHGEVVGLSTV